MHSTSYFQLNLNMLLNLAIIERFFVISSQSIEQIVSIFTQLWSIIMFGEF